MFGDTRITPPLGPWIRTWSVCAKNLSRTPSSRNTFSPCMEQDTDSSVRAGFTAEKRWVLNAEMLLPGNDSGLRTNGHHSSFSASSIRSTALPFSRATLQDEVDS